MRDIEDMLKELGKNKEIQKQDELTKEEKDRIYDRTMKIIMEEMKQESDNETKKDNIVSLTDQMDKKALNKKKVPLFVGKNVAAAAAILLSVSVIGGTACAAIFHLDDAVQQYFHADKKQQEAVIDNVSEPDVVAKSKGVNIKVAQVIGDNRNVYVVLKADNVPVCNDENDMPRNLEFKETDVELSNTVTFGSKDPVLMDNGEEKSEKTKTFVLQVGASNINGKKLTVSLSDLGYYVGKKKFQSLVPGKWNLSWKLDYKNDVMTKDINEEISMIDGKAIWNKIEVSPLSVKVSYKVTKDPSVEHLGDLYEKYDGTERIVVQFVDGTRIDSRFAGTGPEEYGQDDVMDYDGNASVLTFGKIIDVSKIESIRFHDKTVVLQKGIKQEARKDVISKVGNCKISLPEKLADRISFKEEPNYKDPYSKLKGEAATMYVTLEEGDKVPLCTFYRFKAMLAPSDLYEKMPISRYIGYRYDEVYALQYSEVQEFSSEKAAEEYNDIMNKTMSNILPYYEFFK